MRYVLFGLLIVLSVIVTLIVIVLLAHYLFPHPGAWLIKKVFDRPYKIGDSERYDVASQRVKVELDHIYPSKFKRNKLDIYYPAEMGEAVPVVIWVHGGGFVGGDKSQMREFATYVVDQAKVALVAINYNLAPYSTYPNQLHQLDDAYQYLAQNPELSEKLNFSNIILGGDSAGSQITGQYASILTNQTYSQEMSFVPKMPVSSLKGFVSYCGPLDIKQLSIHKSDNRYVSFLYLTIARSLIGTRKWEHRPELRQASIVDYLTEDFPPSYVTDGNVFSFESHGLVFVERLQQLGVRVESLFFSEESQQFPHEYQFSYQTNEARRCLAQTVAFIKTCL